MGRIIKPNEVSIISKDGEVTIHLVLDLNLNLNNGEIATTSIREEKKIEVGQQDEKADWAIPDFTAPSKIKFGKSE